MTLLRDLGFDVYGVEISEEILPPDKRADG